MLGKVVLSPECTNSASAHWLKYVQIDNMFKASCISAMQSVKITCQSAIKFPTKEEKTFKESHYHFHVLTIE
jgi:hypothetical protein